MNTTQTLIDEAGIEILVNYEYEGVDSEDENTDGETAVATMICKELKSVEVVIAGKGIDLLPLMDERQQTAIISKLTYE